MLILPWLSLTWPVTLRIQELVFSGCNVLPNIKETELGSSNQEASPLADKNNRVVLVPCHAWKCVPIAISSGVDVSEVPESHLLGLISSDWGSQKLRWPSVSWTHSLPFASNLFLTQLWPYNKKDVKWVTLNHTTLYNLALPIFEAFIRILLNLNFSLNQTVLTFWLYVRHTWMTQLILAISLLWVIFI